VQTAAEILIGVFIFLIVLVVVGSFVWAAKRDGEEDKAVQKRLGIRRKTRLGR
jgi:flagellar basal body-associated protein FliL